MTEGKRAAAALAGMLAASAAVIGSLKIADEKVYAPYRKSYPVKPAAFSEPVAVSTGDSERYHIESARRLLNDSEQIIAYEADTFQYGFNQETPIRLTCRISADCSRIEGITLLSQQETEYYGDRIRLSSFQEQFAGRLFPLLLPSDSGRGSRIDALSGATLTTRAVLRSADEARRFVQDLTNQT